MVEIGFSENTGDYLVLNSSTSGILNTNKLAAGSGAVATWTDVSPYLMRFSTGTGRQRPLGQFSAGQATFTFLNTTGRFSPTNLSGPYVSGGATQVRPGIAIRFRAMWAGVTYDGWYGYIESWTDEFDARVPSAIMSTVTCSDGFTRIARFEGLAQSAQGAGELSGARINRILDNAGWDPGLRDIDDGQSTMQATTLEGNALSELQLVADSENGEVHMDRAGRVAFDQRYARITDSRSATSQATFGMVGVNLPYSGITPAYDTDLVVNRAQYTRIGGADQVVDDVASQADYGVITDTKSGLFNETDAEVAAAAGWVVGRFHNPEQRVDDITILPQAAPSSLWPQVLGRRMRDRITVKLVPAAGDAISQECFIEGIDHDFDVSSDMWRTKFRLSSASAYAPFFILDSATQGVLNTHLLAY